MAGGFMNPKPPGTGNMFHDIGDKVKEKAKNFAKMKVKARSLISNRVQGIANGTSSSNRVSSIESYGPEQTRGNYAGDNSQGSGMMIWVLIGGVLLLLLNPLKRRKRG